MSNENEVQTPYALMQQASSVLVDARVRYEAADEANKTTERAKTSALNALNDAQKTFDKAVDATRKGAPWNSDWQQRERHHASPSPKES
jgi:hypothetical protein